jgi:hypothetical protein
MTDSHGVWSGRAEVRIGEGAESFEQSGPAVVTAFVRTESREGFEVAFLEWLDEHGVALVDLEAVGPLHEMWDVDEDVLDAALSAAESGAVAAVVYLPVEPEQWDEDPAVDLLRASAGRRDLVELRYMFEDDWISGFVLETNDDWVLLHLADLDRIALDGYAVVRLDRVAEAQVIEDDDLFALRGLELQGQRPQRPEVDIRDPVSIFTTLREGFPLVRVTVVGEDVDHVGRVDIVDADGITLEGVSRSGEWVARERFEYQGLFSVRFGRAYEAALAAVAGPPPT